MPRSSSLKHRSSGGTKPPIFPLVGLFTKDNKSQSKPPTSPGANQCASALSKLKPVPGERDHHRIVRSGSAKTVRFSPDRETGKVSTCKTVKLHNLSKFSNSSADSASHVTSPSSPVKYVSLSPVPPSGKTSVQTALSSKQGGVTILRKEKPCKSPSTSDYDTVANCYSSSESLNEDNSKYSGYDNIDIAQNLLLSSPKEEIDSTANIYDNVAELKASAAANAKGEGDYDIVADYEEILTLSTSVKPPDNSAPPPVPSKHPHTSLSPQSSQEDLTSPWKVNLKERIKPNLQNFKGEKVFKKDTIVTNIYVPGFEPDKESVCAKTRPSDEGSLHISEVSVSDSKQEADSKQIKSKESDISTVKKQTVKTPQSALSKSTNTAVVEKSKRGTAPKSVKWSDSCGGDDAAPPVSKHQLKSSFLSVGVLRKKFTKGNPETKVIECVETGGQTENKCNGEKCVEKDPPRKMSHLRIGVKVLPGGGTMSPTSPVTSPGLYNGGVDSPPLDKPKDKLAVRFCDDCNGSNDDTEVDIHRQLNGSFEQSDGCSDRDSVEMTGSQKDLQQLHLRMIEERKKDQQVAAQEKQRLEDILLMCAEYEKQLESELSPPVPAKESPGEKRSSMTKIKTNGSLTKLTSPTHLTKDSFAFDFKWPRNSASSNSEEDDSEKDGTIKRRPGVANGRVDTNSVLTPGGVAMVTDCAPCDRANVESPKATEPSQPQIKCNGIDTFQPAASPPAIPEPLSIKMPALVGINLCDAASTSPSFTGTKSPLSDMGRSCYSSDNSEHSSTRIVNGRDRVTSSSGVETSSEQSLNGFEVS